MDIVVGDEHRRLRATIVGHRPRSKPGPRRGGRGQALVEFALVLPILLLLVLGLIDFGRAVDASTVVANAAREGTRAAILPSGNDSAVIAAVQAASAPFTIPSGNISISRAPTSVTVSVTASVAPLTPLLGRVFGGAIRVVGTSTEPDQ